MKPIPSLSPALARHQDALRAELARLGTLAVALSGGVDSTLLLDVAYEVLGANVMAITAYSASFPERERAAARNFCAQRGIAHLEVESEELHIDGFADNPPNRCYLCKRELFIKMASLAAAQGITNLAEGSNLDDEGDYRPGLAALAELGVASPLRAAGLTKAAVRELARARGLSVWNKPSFACLASRIPFGERITPDLLARIDAAEQFLLDLGCAQVRVRVHEAGRLARIETDAEGMRILSEASKQTQAYKCLQDLGFTWVTLDVGGYQSGSMNATLPAAMLTAEVLSAVPLAAVPPAAMSIPAPQSR